MRRRLDLSRAAADAIVAGQIVRIPLPQPAWMPDGNLATSVLATRVDGALVVYANLCRHQPVPLDLGGASALAPDGANLFCGSHGALYRAADGRCLAGPCAGLSLFAARVVHEGDGVGIEL